MKKRTLAIKRLSTVALLKIMLITVLFPWVLIDTGIILYPVINGDFVVDYYIGIGFDKVADHISIGKYILLSYPLVVFAGTVFTLMLWVPSALSLWLLSNVRSLQIAFLRGWQQRDITSAQSDAFRTDEAGFSL
jgi:hypothetical protein